MDEKKIAPAQQDTNTQRTFWGTIILDIVLLLVFGYAFSTAIQLGKSLVTYFASAAFLLTIMTTVASIILAIRQRQDLGLKLTYYSLLLVGIVVVTVFQARALPASILILIVSIIGIIWLFPRGSRRWYTSASAAALILIWVIEWINPAWRQSVNMVQAGPIGAIALGLAFGFLLLRQTWSGSLRDKLLASFFGVTIIATGALSAFVIITTTNNQRGSLERELSAVTVSHATQIGDLFVEQINNLTTLGLGEVIQRSVSIQNSSYTGDAAAIQNKIDAKDAQWRAADAANNNADPLVREHLINVAALDLIEYQTAFPDNAEIFVTDIHGGLVGTTNRTSDFNQADEAWWQAAYNNGNGAVYIGSPEFDESAGKLGIQFALPVRNRVTGKVIGIMRTTYIMTPLAAILKQDIGETSAADIFIPGEINSHIHEGVLEPVDPQVFKQLQSVAGQGMAEINYEGVLSVVTQAQLQSRDKNPAIENLGWIVVFHQSRDEAFAPVNAQIQGVIIVIVIVVLFAVIAAVILAQFLSRPLVQLTNTAQKIAAGSLDTQAQVTSSDEIGVLASAFNNMTARLRDFIGTLESRVAERTQNLELAAQVGRAVSQVRALDITLTEAAELIRTQFDLYYTQVYLTDASQTYLVLQAGTGNVGKELLARNHRLPLNTDSINGRAAIEKKSVMIVDTASSPTFKPNPLLPNTRSEVAVPLILGNRVVGVLDMQSEQAGSLDDLLPAFETMAGQLAVAVQNATLLAEIQKSRAEVEAQAKRLTRTNWAEYLDAIHMPEETGFMFEKNNITPLTGQEEPAPNSHNAPIEITGEALGSLIVEMEGESRMGHIDELVKAVAKQVSQQIESLRLLESAERFRYDAEQSSRRLTHEGWQEYTNISGTKGSGYIYDQKNVRPYEQAEIAQAEENGISLPVNVREEAIGKLILQGIDVGDTESVGIARAVAERLGVHIEGLRLAMQTEQALSTTKKQAQREQALRQITSAVRGSTDPSVILRTAVRELGNILGRQTVIQLETTNQPEAAEPNVDENNSSTAATPGQEA